MNISANFRKFGADTISWIRWQDTVTLRILSSSHTILLAFIWLLSTFLEACVTLGSQHNKQQTINDETDKPLTITSCNMR